MGTITEDRGPRVAYFTAGTVGAGHEVRGEAILRALERVGFRGSWRAFAPPSPFALGLATGRETVVVQGDPALADPERAAASALGRALLGWAPDLLVVDMFWAPVRHLLARLSCPAWLLVRACPPVWLQGRGDVRFDAGAWERIVEIEPLNLSQATHRLDPIVIINPDECLPAPALHQQLGVSSSCSLTVVSHAGRLGELEVLQHVANERAEPNQTIVTLDLHRQGLFPAARWLGAAHRIIGGAGYNTFWEARWLGWSDRAVLIPFDRTIDRQRLRVEVLGDHRPKTNGADVMAQWILERIARIS